MFTDQYGFGVEGCVKTQTGGLLMASYIPPQKPLVLVVEDEPLLLMLAVDVVEEAGLKAVEAKNADEAISILESRADISIIFTDIDMPGSMNGVRLAAMVRNRWPPIDIIIVSGHFKLKDVKLPDRSVFYTKPYAADDVTAQLRKMASQH